MLPNAELSKFTHYQKDNQVKLDGIYVSTHIISHSSGYGVTNFSFSDHTAVHVLIGQKKHTNFNLSLCKLNGMRLQDGFFVKQGQKFFKDVSRTVRNKLFRSVGILDAIERSCVLKQAEKLKERELQAELDFLLSKERISPGRSMLEVKKS